MPLPLLPTVGSDLPSWIRRIVETINAILRGQWSALFDNGTASKPSIAFREDTDTGLYREGSDSIGFAVGGVRTATIEASGVYTIDGSAAAPSYSFSLDTDTGIFRSAANSFSIATGGTARVLLDTANLYLDVNFAIQDGVPAPSAISGYAQIYVDAADGDLKVKFGDGTVKTIATDT